MASVPATSAQSSADPWQSFEETLNKGQREYMRKALAGTLRAPKSMTDDAINAIALDTVKDLSSRMELFSRTTSKTSERLSDSDRTMIRPS